MKLSGLISHQLHRIAERYLRGSPDGTLQPTALINEAYLRLVGVQAPIEGTKAFLRAGRQADAPDSGGPRAQTLGFETRLGDCSWNR